MCSFHLNRLEPWRTCLFKVAEQISTGSTWVPLPPPHWAMMKKTAFKTETLPTAIMLIVTAGLSCPPEMWNTAITSVAILKPWLKAMCITEGGELFHGNTVPQTMNRNKSVAKNSAKTSVQNDRDRNSVLPSRRYILLLLVFHKSWRETDTYPLS